MREFWNHAVLSMSDSTMAVSSKYTQDLSVQIVFFTFSCKWFLCFNFWAVIWSYIVDLFAALHELASASARTLLKLASSVRALLKPYGDTLTSSTCSLFSDKARCFSQSECALYGNFIINGYTWQCIALHGYTWLCMAIHGNTLLYIVIM